MTEIIIKKGTYTCPRTWSGVEIPDDITIRSHPQLLESTARIVSDIRYECEELGRERDHDPHCTPDCEINRLVPPLNNLLKVPQK